MKKTVVIFLTLLFVLYSNPVFAGIRCGNDLISIGDTPSEVMLKLRKCGEILDKEVTRKEIYVEAVGEDSKEKVKKEKLIEHWYIRVKERGGMYCYTLSFEEGRLTDIGDWSRCD